ncbi:MAG: hypothetical protein QOJ03_2247 [Frankiaceae bacterium]|nr:hypothetical protein [Frankiaceae bacterium]
MPRRPPLRFDATNRKNAHNPPNHLGAHVRRLIIGTVAVGIAAAAAAPALASPPVPPVPVGVTGNGNNGVCVTVSYQVPQCIDLGQIGATGN